MTHSTRANSADNERETIIKGEPQGMARHAENDRETSPTLVTITPDNGRVGEWGTWTVRFNVDPPGMRSGGGIQIALPERWHQSWRNASRRVQATEPAEP